MSSQRTPAWDAVRAEAARGQRVSVSIVKEAPKGQRVHVSVGKAAPPKHHLWGIAGEVRDAEGAITGVRIRCAECGWETVASLPTDVCPG
jgi:hypothetical protein